MPLIRFNGVAKSFAQTGNVVQDLDLVIPQGQFVSILGPSGCGKSTLLRMIAGLEHCDRGTIDFDREVRSGFVFQEAQLLPWLTVLQNTCLPLELDGLVSNARIRESMAREILFKVGLEDSLAKMPWQLSGGMKMRVSLARALVVKPNLLLMDEPFAALDEITRFQLQEDLRLFWIENRMTIVFVTHSISESAFLADRQIVFSQCPAQVVSDQMSSLALVRDEEVRHSQKYIDEVSRLTKSMRKDVSNNGARKTFAAKESH